MLNIQNPMLCAVLVCGCLPLTPSPANLQIEQEQATLHHSKLFPTPTTGLTIRAEGQTVADLLNEFSAVTGENLMFGPETAKLLESTPTQLQNDLEVSPPDVYSVVQSVLTQNRFVMIDMRREEPRLLSIVSLRSSERGVVKQHARYVPVEQLDDYARDSAMLITTVIDLPNTDVRTMGASMRQLVVDPNTMQLIPMADRRQVILTGFGQSVHGFAKILRRIDEGHENLEGTSPPEAGEPK